MGNTKKIWKVYLRALAVTWVVVCGMLVYVAMRVGPTVDGGLVVVDAFVYWLCITVYIFLNYIVYFSVRHSPRHLRVFGWLTVGTWIGVAIALLVYVIMSAYITASNNRYPPQIQQAEVKELVSRCQIVSVDTLDDKWLNARFSDGNARPILRHYYEKALEDQGSYSCHKGGVDVQILQLPNSGESN